jgi:hypothetical protein
MASLLRTATRLSLGLLLGGLLGGIPLQAQLDPRLQSGKTDFLNLYQESTTLTAKPEILTIFDYSASMSSLMFHPLYRNDDNTDSDPYRSMKFVLTNGSTSPVVDTAPNNRYRIRAYDSTCTGALADYTVTVTATGATGIATATAASCPATTGTPDTPYNTAPTYRIQATAVGNTNAYARASFTPTASGANPSYSIGSYTSTGLRNNTYGDFTVTFTPTSGTYGNGTIVTLTSILVHPPPPVTEPPTANITGQTWSISTIANNPATGGSNPNTYVTSLPAPVVTDLGGNQYRSVTTFTIPAWVPWTLPGTPPGPGNPTQLQPVKVESPGTPSAGPGPTGIAQTFSSGATLTLNTWYLTKGSGNRINWTVTSLDTSNQSCSPIGSISPTYNTGNTNLEQHPLKSVTWKIPNFQDPLTCTTHSGGVTTPAYVTVSLEAGTLGTLSGNTKAASTGASTGGASSMGWLIKPDGTQVDETAADAAAAITAIPGEPSVTLYGTASKKLDVRNWIRAASHVRFKYQIPSTSIYRTIDIPIPWTITDLNSQGTNPLTSQKVVDTLVKAGFDADGNPTTTTYGSGYSIELDRNYKIEAAAKGTFTNDGYTAATPSPAGNALPNSVQTTAYLYSVFYRPSYIAWLFTGKYHNNATIIPATGLPAPNYTTDSALIGKYIVFDAVTTNLAAGQGTNLSWGQGYGPSGNWGNTLVPRYNSDGTYKDSFLEEASKYKVPALTRMQAVKRAAIQTWISHQSDVFWGFRYLDPTGEAGGGAATTINNNSITTISATDATTLHVNGNDSGWKVLNNTAAQGITSTTGNSVSGMRRMASMFASGVTPLTYAMARGLAQYTDPNSVFNPVVGTDVSQCMPHFLILFTDGLDNNATAIFNEQPTPAGEGHNTTPYIVGSGTAAALSVVEGNRAILANPTSIDRTGSNWNLYNFAAIAAHLADSTLDDPTVAGAEFMAAPDPGTTFKTGLPSTFLPYAIKKRNGVTYDKDNRITTMTVGVSLGGQYTDTTSPKRSLFLAAVVGDQDTKSGKLSDFHSFFGWDPTPSHPTTSENDWIPDEQDPTGYPGVGKKSEHAVYFFDATDPDKLSSSMDFAFRIISGVKGNNATASPNLPFVGASLGKQVYIGNFQPPKTGGVVWPGDLFMFGTRETGGTISLINNKGDVVSVIDKNTALWSASNALADRLWSDRTLYTRLPGGTVLKPFKDNGTDYTALKPYLALSQTTWTDDQFKALIQNASGGDTLGPLDTDNRPTNNRTNIMGDIINSAPAALEYNIADSTIANGLAAHSKLGSGERFRLILVGTNQGWLHAFGEVTNTTTITDSLGKPQEIVTGKVDELWSFMPTDFLKNLDYTYGPTSGSHAHRAMVDGTPSIYLLDLPSTLGGGGNGVMDYNSDVAKSERAIAVFGLGKGGRSYYALDIRDPFNPKLKWCVVPDEPSVFTNSTSPVVSDTSLNKIIRTMGFSTSTPGTGRVSFKGKLRDAVFLGGGLSVPEVDANFLEDAKVTPLGRSVMALDVYTGEFLAAEDMTKSIYDSTVKVAGVDTTFHAGPVSAGLIPFEFFLNSGMAQRAYFLDYYGGLWAWGSRATSASTSYKDYRIDSSDLANWTVDGTTSSAPGIRKVYHDTSAPKNWLYSTLPAPFRVGYFRGVGKSGTSSPSAVGVAMVSGDRNNPLDRDYLAGTKPTQHRLTVVFDRQDSRAWGLDESTPPDKGIQDDRLVDMTGSTKSSFPVDPCADSVMKIITPGCNDFYLAPKKADGITPDEANTKFGYFVNFPAATNTAFVSKGINPPIVIAGSLFYTYFEPSSSDPCTGGTGDSHSMLIADVFSPLVTDTRSGIANPSGELTKWSGVSSDYIAVGTRGVLQGGTVGIANATGVKSTIEIKNLQGQQKERYPKARVWRTVQ